MNFFKHELFIIQFFLILMLCNDFSIFLVIHLFSSLLYNIKNGKLLTNCKFFLFLRGQNWGTNAKMINFKCFLRHKKTAKFYTIRIFGMELLARIELAISSLPSEKGNCN